MASATLTPVSLGSFTNRHRSCLGGRTGGRDAGIGASAASEHSDRLGRGLVGDPEQSGQRQSRVATSMRGDVVDLNLWRLRRS